ncbi:MULTISPECIES: orotate phosphoribosyltransferase [Spirosoma]|uniref:Orotate phosphoribosyltransferase n=1 Tax=Spirosoma liriopis TaxID=2937440 RepID=A0ABT0HPT0_9BACT|nr:orotate phosphoribosyltransferase [Spirosoma oryzicola]MCK8494127.1 orotate phosphoribosyltransferase [Spirosoma liriopis]UHG89144.1 orotate phosphoribosyltransferase [Spirosoma oryzicola]
MNSLSTPQAVARHLLSVQAIRLQPDTPFTWSSGWKSPIYCDNRVTLAYPDVRTYIKNALADRIRNEFPSAQVIAGVATAGIPQGALVADALNLPYCYVRPEPKAHGMGKQIEGRLEAGQRVVVIEDLISTGGSSLKVVDALRAAGADVLGMAAIFTYGFPLAAQNFANKNVQLVCLSDYNVLLTEAQELDYISTDALASLAAWRENPADWGK